MNIVILIGRLTRDPEVRKTPSGAEVCNFGLAVDNRFKRGEEWVTEPVFIELAMWGARGAAFAKHHKKGSLASVKGHLVLNQWTDKATNQPRQQLKIMAEEWEFVGGPPKGATTDVPSASDVDDTPF